MSIKKVFIVFAHPEEKSFCSAMKNVISKTYEKIGCQVKISDLYNMKFDEIICPLEVKTNADSLKGVESMISPILKESKTEKTLNLHQQIIQEEIDKLIWCDILFFVYPLYWFHFPGIMNNWIHKVLSVCSLNNISMKGKMFMMLFTSGMTNKLLNPHLKAMLALAIDTIFHPLGFISYFPYIVGGPARQSENERKEILVNLEKEIINLNQRKLYNLIN